jgi:rod shape-determining protein MreB
LAIDLGTSRTRIYSHGRGIVLDEPSTVAIDRNTGAVAAVGSEADGLLGREPIDLAVHRPVRSGAIENVDAAEKMLAAFARRASSARFRRGRLVIGVPGSSTPIEQRAVRNAALDARAVRVDLIDSGLAAALGADLGDDGRAHIVVDIGGGTTDVAVVVGPFVVVSASVKIGGDAIDAAIQDYARGAYEMLVGDRTAEHLKQLVGVAPTECTGATKATIVGKRLVDGFPKAVEVCAREIQEAVLPVAIRIADATRQVVERLKPDAIADVYDTGITLTGGGALLRGMDTFLTDRLGLRVGVAKDPANAAVLGAGRLLARPDSLIRAAVREHVWVWKSAASIAASA